MSEVPLQSGDAAGQVGIEGGEAWGGCTGLPVCVEFTEADHFSRGGQSRLEDSSQPNLSACTYEAQVNLLWTRHNLASLGALRAQIPGYLAHKKLPPPLGPPQGPRHGRTEGS